MKEGRDAWIFRRHTQKEGRTHIQHLQTQVNTSKHPMCRHPPLPLPTYIYLHTKSCTTANDNVRERSCVVVWETEQCIDLRGAVIKRSWSLIRILIILRHSYANEYNTTKHSSSHQYFINWKSLMSPQRWQDAWRVGWHVLLCVIGCVLRQHWNWLFLLLKQMHSVYCIKQFIVL